MVDYIEAVVKRLWQIKGDEPISDMARETGVLHVTLWRIMKGQRRPSGDVLIRLVRAYPELVDIFALPDSPSGNGDEPGGE